MNKDIAAVTCKKCIKARQNAYQQILIQQLQDENKKLQTMIDNMFARESNQNAAIFKLTKENTQNETMIKELVSQIEKLEITVEK